MSVRIETWAGGLRMETFIAFARAPPFGQRAGVSANGQGYIAGVRRYRPELPLEAGCCVTPPDRASGTVESPNAMQIRPSAAAPEDLRIQTADL